MLFSSERSSRPSQFCSAAWSREYHATCASPAPPKPSLTSCHAHWICSVLGLLAKLRLMQYTYDLAWHAALRRAWHRSKARHEAKCADAADKMSVQCGPELGQSARPSGAALEHVQEVRLRSCAQVLLSAPRRWYPGEVMTICAATTSTSAQSASPAHYLSPGFPTAGRHHDDAPECGRPREHMR